MANPPPSLPRSNLTQPMPPTRGPGFLMGFLGALVAILILAVIGMGIYFGAGYLQGGETSGSGSKKDVLKNAASWQVGSQSAKPLGTDDHPDIGWWAHTFSLPDPAVVTDYLKKQGLTLTGIEPSHFEDTKDATTIAYQVHAQVPGELLRVPQTTWTAQNADDAHFAGILVLNEGLAPGVYWDTDHASVAAAAGTKLDFLWQVRLDKTAGTVSTDRLPFTDNVVSRQQVTQYQTETNQVMSHLDQHIQQIDAQISQNTQAQLAQVPADPPKPKPLSSKFGGDGSGEPTKSAERIGGGTAAGAAGGAAFGAMAGDAGMGAGIGAGVGLLGGLIYDGVSKSNDKKKQQRAVADANAERLSDWKAQIKSLNQQRTQIKQDAVQQREDALNSLANSIVANHGHLSGMAQTNQPSGPVQQP